MANISDCSIEFTGNLFDLKAASEAIDNSTKDLPLIINSKKLTADSLSIQGEGRWSVESTYFIDLAHKHNLSGYFTDAESGSDFFRLIEFDNGEVVYDQLHDYFSKEHVDWLEDKHYWYDHYSWIFEEEDWETKYEEIYDMLLYAGWTESELKDN